MFETNDRIRVSVEPTQKSCSEGDCQADVGPQFNCEYSRPSHYVYLELLVHVDVPYDPNNKYKFTGVYNASTITPSASGCHWGSAIYDDSYTPTASHITRYETRGDATSPSAYEYVRSTVRSTAAAVHLLLL